MRLEHGTVGLLMPFSIWGFLYVNLALFQRESQTETSDESYLFLR